MTGNADEHTQVLVEGACELVERRRHLEALFEDAALALDAHDLGPLHEPVQVLLGRERAADAKLLRPLLEQRVRHLLLQPAKAVPNQPPHSKHGISKRNMLGYGTYGLLLRRYRRPATSLRGLQI
jgi:hypothetical protein